LGMLDPLPRRHGIWEGLYDELELILPPADAKDPEKIAAGGYEPGAGAEHFLTQIGGAAGCRGPSFKALSSYIAINDSDAHLQPHQSPNAGALRPSQPGWARQPKRPAFPP